MKSTNALSIASALAPFAIEPRFVDRVWGFEDLSPWYQKPAGGPPIGEVWLTGNECLVSTGPHAGKTLGALFDEAPEALLGPGAPAGSPLLIKIVFAREKLSVQVHPDDALAQKYGHPRGKTECWYALAASTGAQVAAGLNPGATLEEVKRGVEHGTLENSLHLVSMLPGDMVLVDAGTVHAIWPGSILLETQQNCDLTYRLYDYGRPRELHVDRALEATRLHTREGKIAPRPQADRTILIDAEYFRVEQIPVQGRRAGSTLAGESKPAGLAYLFAAAGRARICGPGFDAVDLQERGTVAIPAAAPEFIVEAPGTVDLIRISPHWRASHLVERSGPEGR